MNGQTKRVAVCAPTLCVSLALVLTMGEVRAASIRWTDNDLTGAWNTTDDNWVDAGPAIKYVDVSTDSVEFNDSDASGGTVTIQGGGVTPISTTVTGTLDYTLSGGSILGGTFVKSGTNMLTLTNSANSFSSADFSGGTTDITNTNQLGSGTLTFSDDATISYNPAAGPTTLTNAVTITNDKTANLYSEHNNTSNWLLTGKISGGTAPNPVTIVFGKPASGGTFQGFSLENSTNDFVGKVHLQNRAKLEYNDNDSAYGAAGNSISTSGSQSNIDLNGFTFSRDIDGAGFPTVINGTLAGVITGGISPSSTVTLTNTGNNMSQLTIGSTGTAEVSDPGNIGASALIHMSSNGTLRMTGTPAGNFASTLRLETNGSPGAKVEVSDASAIVNWTGPIITRQVDVDTLTKTGPGTFNSSNFALTGSTGTLEVEVNNGRLNFNDSTVVADTFDDVTVASIATLGGTGLISLTSGATVTVDGTIAPGTSAGQLTISGSGDGLDINSGGTYLWELAALLDDVGGTPGTDFDQLVVSSGDVVLDVGATLELSFGLGLGPDDGDSFWSDEHTWTVLDFSGGGTSSDNFTALVNGDFDAGTFSVSNFGGNLQLNFAPTVPEPSSFLLLGLGAMGLVRHTRRRRRG